VLSVVKVGIEQKSAYHDLLKDKRIGLISNPTGCDHEFTSTIDILRSNYHLVSLFSPEHGIRGDLQAGVKLDTYTDEITGCTVYSLYGDTKKPTKEMLLDIDVLCFDIQDVGARFYTYIYTMAYAMMAAKENHKTFVVFDRPNPVGGLHVEGNILDLSYRSFVGYYPLVQRYGLTIGELALMMNTEYEINCDLHVVLMEGYNRSMDYEDTKRHFILPSPNIPTAKTIYSYLATCIFEGTNLSEGRGTAKPFETIGAPWLDHISLIKQLNKSQLKGVLFRPVYFTPKFSKHADKLCKGIEIYITDKDKFQPVITGFTILDYIKRSNQEFEFLPPYRAGGTQMIDLLVGDSFLRINELSLDEIKEKLEKDSEAFRELKERYHLYEL
jgi:uncharacterized protein YbbC (DUF1343 family)